MARRLIQTAFVVSLFLSCVLMASAGAAYAAAPKRSVSVSQPEAAAAPAPVQAAAVPAQEVAVPLAGQADNNTIRAGEGLGSPAGKLAFGMLFVSGLMLAAFYAFKKFMGKRGFVPGNERLIKVVSAAPLGMKSSVVLVEVVDNYMLLGVSDGKINLLSRIDRKARKAEAASEAAVATAGDELIKPLKKETRIEKRLIKPIEGAIEGIIEASMAPIKKKMEKTRKEQEAPKAPAKSSAKDSANDRREKHDRRLPKALDLNQGMLYARQKGVPKGVDTPLPASAMSLKEKLDKMRAVI